MRRRARRARVEVVMMSRIVCFGIVVIGLCGCVGEYPEYEEPKAEAERARQEAETKRQIFAGEYSTNQMTTPIYRTHS